jgi:YgiT-type zinc finger domain-containing protein
MNKNPVYCPFCKGNRQPGTTTFTVDMGFGVIVVRNVPAQVCSQCGEEWIEDPIAERLEKIVENARKKQPQLEVMAYSPQVA